MSVSLSPARILIVDDEVLIARDIQNQLEALGYQVVGHATRGDDVIDLTRELRPDLVLMDIQLSGTMDGIAAAHAIRTEHALPVVFLTAFAADDLLERAKLTEPFGYILKPFLPRELRTVIEMALFKHKTQAQLVLSEAFARSILDSVSSEIAVLDRSGIIIAVNEPCAALHWKTAPALPRSRPAPMWVPITWPPARHAPALPAVISGTRPPRASGGFWLARWPASAWNIPAIRRRKNTGST